MNVTIGRYVEHDENNRDEFVEFTFWGLAGWHDTQAIYSDNYLGYETNAAGQLQPVIVSHNLYSTFRP